MVKQTNKLTKQHQSDDLTYILHMKKYTQQLCTRSGIKDANGWNAYRHLTVWIFKPENKQATQSEWSQYEKNNRQKNQTLWIHVLMIEWTNMMTNIDIDNNQKSYAHIIVRNARWSHRNVQCVCIVCLRLICKRALTFNHKKN